MIPETSFDSMHTRPVAPGAPNSEWRKKAFLLLVHHVRSNIRLFIKPVFCCLLLTNGIFHRDDVDVCCAFGAAGSSFTNCGK